jgi:hypothetical protein
VLGPRPLDSGVALVCRCAKADGGPPCPDGMDPNRRRLGRTRKSRTRPQTWSRHPGAASVLPRRTLPRCPTTTACRRGGSTTSQPISEHLRGRLRPGDRPPDTRSSNSCATSDSRSALARAASARHRSPATPLATATSASTPLSRQCRHPARALAACRKGERRRWLDGAARPRPSAGSSTASDGR